MWTLEHSLSKLTILQVLSPSCWQPEYIKSIKSMSVFVLSILRRLFPPMSSNRLQISFTSQTFCPRIWIHFTLDGKQNAPGIQEKGTCKWKGKRRHGLADRKHLNGFCCTSETAVFIQQEREQKIRTSWNNAVLCWANIWQRNKDVTVKPWVSCNTYTVLLL